MSDIKVHISASQIKTVKECELKHWLQKVGKHEVDDEKLGAIRGKKLHSILEAYLSTDYVVGETVEDFAHKSGMYEHDLRHGLRSASSVDLLYNLRKQSALKVIELLVEHKFTMSPVFLGFIDLIVIGDKITIRDHKFLSDKRYIPTPEKAYDDPQTLIYARAVMYYFGVQAVDFAYDFYGTRYKWQKTLTLNLTQEYVDSNWNKVTRFAEIALDNYTIVKAVDSTPNYLSCQNYGGCKFKSICFGET